MRDVLFHAALLLKLVHTSPLLRSTSLSPIEHNEHIHIPRQNFFIKIIFIY